MDFPLKSIYTPVKIKYAEGKEYYMRMKLPFFYFEI